MAGRAWNYMEENQRENQETAEKRGLGPLVFAMIFAVIYFLFPAILLYPEYLLYGHNPPRGVQAMVNIVFYPDIKLERASPAYERLIEWEARLLGM